MSLSFEIDFFYREFNWSHKLELNRPTVTAILKADSQHSLSWIVCMAEYLEYPVIVAAIKPVSA